MKVGTTTFHFFLNCKKKLGTFYLIVPMNAYSHLLRKKFFLQIPLDTLVKSCTITQAPSSGCCWSPLWGHYTDECALRTHCLSSLTVFIAVISCTSFPISTLHSIISQFHILPQESWSLFSCNRIHFTILHLNLHLCVSTPILSLISVLYFTPCFIPCFISPSCPLFDISVHFLCFILVIASVTLATSLSSPLYSSIL